MPKGVALIKDGTNKSAASDGKIPDTSFEPFAFNGLVSLTAEPDDQHNQGITLLMGSDIAALEVLDAPWSREPAKA